MKTYAELGRLMLAEYGQAHLESAYAHDCSDPEMVGLSAVAWGDIERDGTLT